MSYFKPVIAPTTTYSNVIHLCINCGEKCGGNYCRWCKTEEGRLKVVKMNEEIKKENLLKGFNY